MKKIKKKYYYSLIGLCIIEFLALLTFINRDSWFMKADVGSIVGIRTDYSIQLTNEGELIDNRQIAPNKIISTNISKYILVKLQDLGAPYNHNILIMEEGNQTPPVYIIYDEMLDGYVFVNKNIDFIGYWVGGYQILSDTDDFINKRYKSLLESQSWVKVER